MDYSRAHPPSPSHTNHSSATAFPQDIRRYIKKEIFYGSIAGPFPQPPFTPWFQTNPLMSRPKKDSTDRRVILDLSWPLDFSVNDGIDKLTYLGNPYKLYLPCVDDLINLVIKHGPGCYLYSRDMARAYRQLRCDPADWPLLGILWDNEYYFDISVPFGIRIGAMCCQRTTNGICYIMSKEHHDALCYIDDFAGVETTLELANASFCRLNDLFHELGVEQNTEKACPPSQIMTWIGVEFDTINMLIRIPDSKINETLRHVSEWRCANVATRTQLRSLLGKLFHIAKCCKPARLFVSRMLDTLRSSPPHGYIRLSEEFMKDIAWFLMFLPTYNGIHLMTPLTPDLSLEADSCLTGCGAICGREYYHTMFPEFILVQNMLICHLEMLNIVAAIKLWGPTWKNKRVHILCDNSAAIMILQHGRGRDSFLLQCAQEVWLQSAIHKFEVIPRHIPGRDMSDADALSRSHLDSTLLTKFSDGTRNRRGWMLTTSSAMVHGHQTVSGNIYQRTTRPSRTWLAV